MDAHYHNLPAHTSEVEVTATDHADTGNTVQRSTYHQGSPVSDGRNNDDYRIEHFQPHVFVGNTEKGPQLTIAPTSPLEPSNRVHHENPLLYEHPARFMRLKNLAHDWWLWELGALAISFAAMLALVVVLRVHEGKTLPRWPLHITLNAFISVTSTIMKAAIAVPITASISQMKWIWFKKRNPVRGMQVFDEASRGPQLALKLLFSRCVLSLASLGALIILL